MSLKLSSEQIEAINAEKDKICILACAGSGKTTTLTQRIARLIKENKADPGNVAAITFTVLAADRLKWELSTLIGTMRSSKIFIGTIHAFCANILRESQLPSDPELRILSESQQFVLLERFWKEWDIAQLNPDKPKGMLLRSLAETINLAKIEQIDAGRILQDNPLFYNIFSSYNNYIRENSFFDFSDLLIQALKRIKDSDEFLSKVRNKYLWLFVDEYQDVDNIQAEFISSIACGENNKLCVVGDDDQSIYQFRGTDVRIILVFAQDISVITKNLSINRRCPSNILSIAENCITKVTNRLPKQMESMLRAGKIIFQQFENIEDEVSYIVKTINYYISSGISNSYSDIAILMRSVASYGKNYIDALRYANIPYVSRGDRGLFDRPEVSAVVSTCEWLAKEEHNVQYLVLLWEVFGLTHPDKWDNSPKMDIYDLSQDDLFSIGFSNETITIFQSLLKIREHYHGGRFGSLLGIVLEVIAALELWKERSDAEMFNLGCLTQIVLDFDEIRQTRYLTQLCAFFSMYAKHSFDTAEPIETEIDAVKVLTVHQAKGLEFDHVFLPMLVDQRFPLVERTKYWLISKDLFPYERYKSTIETERRLFYVACTRSRRSLHLLCSRDVGITSRKKPSKFFIEAKEVKLPEKNAFPQIKERVVRTKESYICTSYSALEYYLTCPYRYKLIIIYGLATPVNPFFEFGRIIHSVLHIFHQSLIDRNKMSEPEVCALYEQMFRIRYNVPKFVLEKRKRAGLEGLKKYLKEKKKWQALVKSTETDFELLYGNCLLRGRIDLVLEDTMSKAQIVDFKTGKPHDYLRTDFQMQVYSLAAKEVIGTDLNQASLYYIEQGQEVAYDVNPGFINEAEKTLSMVVEGILSKNFEPTPGAACTRCEVRRFCSV